jgi:hypothetical protein
MESLSTMLKFGLPSRFLNLVLLVVGIFCPSVAGQQVEFATDIRSILNKHCLACHGADQEHRAAGLRLDNYESATESVIVPGQPESSELYFRISSDDESYVMPPPEHGKLSEEEIKLIGDWIQSGAKYQAHWSFTPPRQTEIPQTQLENWSYNEVDHFVAAKLEAKHLTPSEPADPHQLLRRLALDLTGLPPSDEQISKFTAKPDLETYEQMVDELLNLPTYGEHWASVWLDLARYADTIGYTEDHSRTIWPWRDWVIRALNENMPFDQFTIEQLAGDLLPNATAEQRLATAFHRNTLSNSEGGTIDEEFRVIAVKDRINTTINVWMGLTMRCAECHTHKYDPISIEEYYQFYDFFNQTADADRSDEEPRLDYLPTTQRELLAALDMRLAEKRVEAASIPRPWLAVKPTRATSADHDAIKIQDDQSISVLGATPANADISFEIQIPPGKFYGLRLEVLPEPEKGNQVGLSDGGNFILSKFSAELAAIWNNDENQNGNHQDKPPKQPDQLLEFSDAIADFMQNGYDILDTIRKPSEEKGWAVAGAPDGFRGRRIALFEFKTPLDVGSDSTLMVTLGFHSKRWPKHIISRFRVSAIIEAEPVEKFRQNNFDPLDRELADLLHQRLAVSTPVKVPIMVELAENQRRITHLMTRGSYLSPAEKVEAQVLAAFHEWPQGAPRNRLGVAQWLIDPENPLTARVTVNRFWARLFGRGIVETEEDFGLQGNLPTRPELLDWLAVDFREHGWDVKRLLKQLVMSATYRQSSQATPDRLAADPQNRFLSRGPRNRLSAEVVRDQALMVSGLLSNKMYGPPVYPPSPIKVIRNAFAGDFVWQTSDGEDRYRRAIYTYLKRSQPHPLFDTFDMATRQVCSFRRINTNTPLQSFMTLNDEAFVECALHLARRMLEQSNNLDEQLRWGLKTALRCPPDEVQVEVLHKLVQKVRAEYSRDIDSATQLVRQLTEVERSMSVEETVELACLTVAANVILNLDAFLTK